MKHAIHGNCIFVTSLNNFCHYCLRVFNEILIHLFSENHTNKIQNFMLDVMCPIIQEGESVSQELLDAVLINIIEPQKVMEP